jgi:L-ascorbate metabolism protein UlaG (beta-lactamase superfamily)
MKLTYYGHASFAVFAGGKHILFDPFITGNELAKSIDVNSIKADYIFVSHGHGDHIGDTVAIANRTGATVVGSYELYSYFAKLGVQKFQPLNPGGQFGFDFGAAKSFTGVHSSSFADGSYAGVASGFALKTADGNFYYSGDTALTYDMTLVPKWANIDFAVFPIGDVLTMGVDDGLEAAHFVKTTKVVGVHYDTFPFIKIDTAKATQSFEKGGVKLFLPKIGETIDINR